MDPTKSSAATAAGIAADYSARATYARGYEDGSRHVDEVGIQLAAAQAVIAKLNRFVLDVRAAIASMPHGYKSPAGEVLHDFDMQAVPGDALPHGALASSGRLAALDARWVGSDGEPER